VATFKLIDSTTTTTKTTTKDNYKKKNKFKGKVLVVAR